MLADVGQRHVLQQTCNAAESTIESGELLVRNKSQNVQAEAKDTSYKLASIAWVCPTACWMITQHLTKLGTVRLPKSPVKMG